MLTFDEALARVLQEAPRLGHEIVVYERLDGWSRLNAISDGGEEALQKAAADVTFYRVNGGNHGWNFWTPAVLKLVHDFFDAKLKSESARRP